MTRPTRTKPDANQLAERARLVKLGYTCIDVHDLPGKTFVAGENALDEFVKHPGLQVWVQVEWKTPEGRKLFTHNETVYFKSQGVWDAVESGLLEPAAQWRQHGVPVVVAWEARQIVELFAEMGRCANRSMQLGNSA
jgi:hypothetical protein